MTRFKKFRVPKITTVIGRETELLGDVKFHGGLHVDGSIRGDVTGASDERCALILSESGTVEGDVRVSNVILNGVIIGDVYASERAELAPQARVSGTLYYRLLEMSMGAEVNGQLVHMEEEETPMLSYDGEERTMETSSSTDEERTQHLEQEPRAVDKPKVEVMQDRRAT